MHANELTVSRYIRWNSLLLTLGWIILGIAIPQMGMPQVITGPLVNALLLITVETTGVGAAVLVGLTTPLSALTHGVLPLPLMIMLPFIGIANAMLSTTYSALKDKNKWLALIAGAALKFFCLYSVTTWLTIAPLQVNVGRAAQAVYLPPTLVTMMQWPQLVTALSGGLIAFGITWSLKHLPLYTKR